MVEQKNVALCVILTIVTCGIYQLYWFYKMGNRLQANGPRYGVAIAENGSTILLWMIVGSLLCGVGTFIAWNIIIKNTNLYANLYNRQFTPQPPTAM